MTQLANILQQNLHTTNAIYAHYKKVGDSQTPRGYLGASIIGHSCDRYLWYTFRFCCKPEFDGRMYRLFETGEREEERIVRNLREIGCEVHPFDEKGNQFEVLWFGGHFGGHLDGVVKGLLEASKTWHVLECKTHNAKSFNKLKKDGVKKAHYKHYAQMQIYMLGTKLTRALYFAVCKDTDEIYCERVKFNKEEAEQLLKRAKYIISTSEPPPRISSRPDYYECNYCSAKEICWGGKKALPIPEKNCKQCCYSTPDLEQGGWQCEKGKWQSKSPNYLKVCDEHFCLPGLFPFAKPVDYTDGMIVFENDDGRQWHHGGFCLSTDDLMKIDKGEL